MSLEFDYYYLGDLVKIKYGKNQKKVQDDENGQYPIFGTGGLMGYSMEYLYDKPSVLIGRKGSIEKVRYIDCRHTRCGVTLLHLLYIYGAFDGCLRRI